MSKLENDFVAKLSHELRAPLNVVSGMAHLLGQTALDQQQSDYLRELEAGVAALRKVVAEVLDYSDADTQRLDLRPEEFRLSPVIEGLMQQLEARAGAKEVELVSRIASDVPDLIWGDPLRWGQLLKALLENAIKFAAGGRVSLSVDVMDSGRLQLKVLDSGIGMTAEQLAGLLGSFAPAQASQGFPLSRRLVERMDGSIRVDSQAGQGTLVTVELPVRPGGGRQPLPAVRRGGPGEAVLVVEDSPVNQRIVVELLERAGAKVEVAGNGREALERAFECDRPWKVILMDLEMPEMDGYTAARRIRLQSRFDDVPILAMSSHVLGEERDRCREAGMDDFVFKPVDPPAWFAVLNRWLNLRTDSGGDQFPRLTQVNTAAGMRACGGNPRFYRNLLLDFAERCGHSVWELETALGSGDCERVKFLAHTLHGVAANLGAEELARLCARLGEKLRFQTMEEAQEETDLLVAQVRLLSQTLPAELSEPAAAASGGEWTAERASATRAAMAALSGHLARGSGDSLDSVQDLISLAAPLAGELGHLERLVNQFDFSAALRELEELRLKVP